MTDREKIERHRTKAREYARRKAAKKRAGAPTREKWYVSEKKRWCEKCKKGFVPESNNQKICHVCRPRKFVKQEFIRPHKDPIEKMLDELEWGRSKTRSKEGWM